MTAVRVARGNMTTFSINQMSHQLVPNVFGLEKNGVPYHLDSIRKSVNLFAIEVIWLRTLVSRGWFSFEWACHWMRHFSTWWLRTQHLYTLHSIFYLYICLTRNIILHSCGAIQSPTAADNGTTTKPLNSHSRENKKIPVVNGEVNLFCVLTNSIRNSEGTNWLFLLYLGDHVTSNNAISKR